MTTALLTRERSRSLWFIGAGAALILLLHVVPPTSRINPVTVTISEYGRTPLWFVFALGVVLIAVGSVLGLVALVRAGVFRWVSAPSLGLVLWALGMLAVAAFPKADWDAGATWVGYAHRAASIVAFVALAVTLVLLRRLGSVVALTGTIALVALAVFGGYVAWAESSGVIWWVVLPLGAIERTLITVELVGLVSAVWIATRPAGDGFGRGLRVR